MPRTNPQMLVCYVNGKPDSSPHTTTWTDLASAQAALSARRDELIAANVEVGPMTDQADGDGAGCIVAPGTAAGLEGAVIEIWTSGFSAYWNGVATKQPA